MEDKKLLFILPSSKLWARVVRRGLVVAVLTFIAILLKGWILPAAPEIWIPVISAILVSLDKIIRELTAEK